jgi:hypothetical protein
VVAPSLQVCLPCPSPLLPFHDPGRALGDAEAVGQWETGTDRFAVIRTLVRGLAPPADADDPLPCLRVDETVGDDSTEAIAPKFGKAENAGSAVTQAARMRLDLPEVDGTHTV